MIITTKVPITTQGNGHTLNITPDIERAVQESAITNGIVALFVPGSTASLTTIEFEPGAVADFSRAFERIAPVGAEYEHHLRWHDDNGHSHVRAALLGPSLTVPIVAGSLTLGTWQQIVLVDFDTRPRRREVVAQIIGD